MKAPVPALFVSSRNALEAGGGGVQRCTREYRAALEAAGFALHPIAYDVDRRPATRLRRKLQPQPYRNILPAELATGCITRAEEAGARWIFLNTQEAAPLALELDRIAPGNFHVVALSHGLDSMDYFHEVRLRLGRPGRPEEHWLGAQLFAEMQQRRRLAAVLCLSETDRLFEHWIGARHVHVVPRILSETPLDRHPQPGRAGTVSTLNHHPNREGIVLLAAALTRHPHVTLRVVGGPEKDGAALARDHANLDYLGPLDDAALAREAASWTSFVNPIFCLPKGASTKLAVPLGWHLPVVTTRAGARGYRWDENISPYHDEPHAFATAVARLAEPENFSAAAEQVAALAALSPTLAEVGADIRRFLDSLPAD